MKGSEFPGTPLLFGLSKFKKHNILVGEDDCQQRFAEQMLDGVAEPKETVRDEDILGKDEGCLYRVVYGRDIELSPQVRKQVGIYSLDSIERGSAGANALIRQACVVLEIEKPDAKWVQGFADQLCREPIYDIRAALWHAVWLIAEGTPEEFKSWPEPWSIGRNWLPSNVDPQYRLNSLYRDLVGLVFALENDQAAAQKFHIKPSKFAILKSVAQSLDHKRIGSSIRELSRWRQQKYNPLVCALKISAIWEA